MNLTESFFDALMTYSLFLLVDFCIDFAFTKQPVIDTIMIQTVIVHIKIICVEVFCIFLLNEVRIRKYTIKIGYKIIKIVN